MRRIRLTAMILLPLAGAAAAFGAWAQQPAAFDSPAEIRGALIQAQREGNSARQRAERLEKGAMQVTGEAERTAREAAGIAARIQQAQAAMAVSSARLSLIEQQRQVLRVRLAEKQQPLVRLTAALQRLSRRPPVLALLRPGSVRDAMYLRAVLSTLLPEVERRTAALRAELAQAKALQRQARLAVLALGKSEAELEKRRQRLVALETRQRLAARTVGSIADRENERALALAERAGDLNELADELGKAGSLRAELAALPGPVLRPARPEDARVAAAAPPSALVEGLPSYMLPVTGRLVAGFGEAQPGQPRSRGIALAARQGAQAVAPAPGRVAFAGPYRGYGSIVIIEHAGGWTSLVTGLAQLDTKVGDRLVGGSPLGIAGAGRPVITLELRRRGEPVNPLEYIRAL
jgi:murein hydrolase activator